MAELEILFQEARPADAESLLTFLQKASQDSDFIILDQELSLSVSQMERVLADRLQALDQLTLLAKADDQVLALISLRTGSSPSLDHIADLFLVVDRNYWGHGLAQLLLQEGLAWAQEGGFIRRIELTVQARNDRALHIYKKFAFGIEGSKSRGAKTKDGEFLDVYMMSRLLD